MNWGSSMKFQFGIIYLMLCSLSRELLGNREDSLTQKVSNKTLNIRVSGMIYYKLSIFPTSKLFINWSWCIWICLSYLDITCPIVPCRWMQPLHWCISCSFWLRASLHVTDYHVAMECFCFSLEVWSFSLKFFF